MPARDKRKKTSDDSVAGVAKHPKTQATPSQATSSAESISSPVNETERTELPNPPIIPTSQVELPPLQMNADDWNELKTKALERLSELEKRKKQEQSQLNLEPLSGLGDMIRSFYALLEWLPSEGSQNLAREILQVSKLDSTESEEAGDLRIQRLYDEIKLHLLKPSKY